MVRRSQPLADQTGLGPALAGAADGAFTSNADGRILSWNRSAEQILGYTAREVLGRPCCDVLAGVDAEGNRMCYRGCQVMTLVGMDEPVQHFDLRARTKAGRTVWLNISILAATSAAGERTTIHLFRDVTATRELLMLIHERLAPPSRAGDPGSPAAALSRRELEVLRCMSQGLNTAATADRLHVSRATIRNHVQNIFGKIGAHSRLEAVAFATRHRLF